MMFDSQGFFKPLPTSSVFSYPPKEYYRLNLLQSEDTTLDNISSTFSVKKSLLVSKLTNLLEKLEDCQELCLLNNGPRIPFYLSAKSETDIGTILETKLLPLLKQSFLSRHPDSHFKAVSQDKCQLHNRLSPSPKTNYEALVHQLSTSNIVGYYYPLAFFQHSISSQKSSFCSLPSFDNLCLSGPLEIISALIANPSLLIHPSAYSPILNMSGADYIDSRLIPCLKSYGPHLEMWILSNILSPGIEQVSEQWSGGLTIYSIA